MAYSNPKEAFENIVEGARSGLMSAFPIKGRAHSLHLEDVAVEAKDTKDPMDIASQYKARMAGESWFTPLYGKLVIRDNATNAVVQSKKMRLMDLPTMTSGSSSPGCTPVAGRTVSWRRASTSPGVAPST